MVGVADRMAVFEPSIEQMLWPEKRAQDPLLKGKVHGVIDRTTKTSWVVIAPDYVPGAVRLIQGPLGRFYPGLVYRNADRAKLDAAFADYPKMDATMDGSLVVGPIPAGMPVNLLANTMLRSESHNPIDKIVHAWRILWLVHELRHDRKALTPGASGEALREQYASVRAPLLALNKCPDFVVNRGHLFGTEAFNHQDGLTADEKSWGTEKALGDDDKRALIAFLKTF